MRTFSFFNQPPSLSLFLFFLFTFSFKEQKFLNTPRSDIKK